MSAAFLLNPARFGWLDRLPAPRMPRWRRRGQHHADVLTPPQAPAPGWTGPRHASTERINCGGLRRGGLADRRDPGATIIGGLIDRGPDHPPWLTSELAVLAGECSLPSAAQLRNEYFRWRHPMPDFSARGDYGTMPVLEAARLTAVYLP